MLMLELPESAQFAEAGDNQHTLKAQGSDNVRSSLKGVSPAQGNSATYLAARLKKADKQARWEKVNRKPGNPTGAN